MPVRLKPLSGLDAGFLYLEASGTPMHVGSLMLLERPRRRGYDFCKALVAHLAGRLPSAPALRRTLVDAPLDLGHPMWRDAGAVDLGAHVLTVKLPKPGSARQLETVVARLHARMLPRERPLWQFVVIEGLASGEVALYSKIHHALIDGQGGIALAKALLDVEASPPPRPAAAPAASKRVRRSDAARTAIDATIAQFGKMIRGVPEVLRLARDSASGGALELLGRIRDSVLLAPRTPFNVQVCPQRAYATASLPLDAVKGVGRALDASLNDVVMALCADALREVLGRRDALPKKPLVAAMPVSLRAAGDSEANNQVSMVQCPLPTDVDDPVERVRAVRATTGRIKEQVATFRSLIPTDFPGLAAPIWASGLSRLWARGRVAERLPPLANVAISNVPGPPFDLFLAGSRLTHYYPVSIVTHGLALNITVQSYSGKLEFGIVSCRDALPRPDGVARGIEKALTKLVRRVGIAP